MVDIYNQFRDFKSFEIVFIDANGIPQKLYATIKSINNNNIIVSTNNEKNHGRKAKIGDDLKLYIYTDNGIYSSVSKVIDKIESMLNTTYKITYPSKSKHSQRREYFRADLPVDFEMTVFLDNNHYNKDILDGKTRNICGKGMSFLSDKPFLDYYELEITLKFPQKTITTNAELVYTQTIILNKRPVFVHAFTFVDIKQSHIDYIVKQCFLHQLDLRKKTI